MDLQDENTAFHITFNSLPDKHHLPLTLIPELRTDKRFYSARKQAVKEVL